MNEAAFNDPDDRAYKNEDITVYWRPGKCIHATTCYRELIEVFNPRKRPWVNMEGAPTEKIIEIVKKCPTDALTFRYNDEEKQKQEEEIEKAERERRKAKIKEQTEEESAPGQEPANIQVMKQGPLVVSGSFAVFDSNGNQLRNMAMTSFCRCGNSQSMPFCDGTHRKIGFNK